MHDMVGLLGRVKGEASKVGATQCLQFTTAADAEELPTKKNPPDGGML
jgi:hypothetical protein